MLDDLIRLEPTWVAGGAVWLMSIFHGCELITPSDFLELTFNG
jgi:hypothetical protein